MGYKAINRTEVVINKQKFLEMLNGKTIVQFHRELAEKFGLSIKYKAFVNLLDNRITWKLTYAWCVAKLLDTSIEELFIPVQKEV